MEKGDISTTALVAIILGVILAVVFVYLVYFYPKQAKLDCSLCKAEFTYWCSECNTTGDYSWAKVKMSDDLVKCLPDCLSINPPPAPDYNDCRFNNLPNKCKSYIPGLVIP